MILFGAELNIIIQGLITVIIIGMFYTVWASTRAYGGIIGQSLRLLGFGILFMSVAVIEKMLINFSVITDSANISLTQDVFNLVGLALSAWGFSRLASASRA
ncbi:MAG TPA: hypothetical protein VD998_00365 [Verrucomicrobiae bacterium]|nr:hypothetical protein [Verrucomicrobiae bacterium]